MPKISVIIPCCNVEKYIGQCLDSIIGQTLADFEIICVDDGSTDDTLNIINGYAEKDGRIKVLQQKNQYACFIFCFFKKPFKHLLSPQGRCPLCRQGFRRPCHKQQSATSLFYSQNSE